MVVKIAQQERLLLEGSRAVAEAVMRCRPRVVAAYPITPQTHIVAELSQMVADADLKAGLVNVESEHSAASVVLGASATGARAYTATSSQGFFLMLEVLYNIAGMRLPLVLTCVNRSVSAPINIWADQQDSLAARDTGWIQLYAENNQEVLDMHIQAFRIAEDHRVLLPVMICMSGYVLTHAYEPVWVPSQGAVDEFLPPYEPLVYLTPEDPVTMGTLATPEYYMETRYAIQASQMKALTVIEEVAQEYREAFGRWSGGLIQEYRTEGASLILVSFGSVVGTLRDAVDELRAEGKRIGLVKVRSFRPFPAEALWEALKGAERIAVLEQDVSLGSCGALVSDLKAAFYNRPSAPPIAGFIAGLGGRDITVETVKGIVAKVEEGKLPEAEFVDLRVENLGGEL